MSRNLAEIYRARRRKLVEKTGGGVILVGSPGAAPDKNLLDKNLLYLTGIDDRNAYLLIVPNGVAVEHSQTRSTPELMQGRIVHEILFVQERSERDAFMDGAAPTFEALREATGVDRVFSIGKLNESIQRALMKNDTLWFNTGTTPELDKPLMADLLLINSIRERFWWVTLKNVAVPIHLLRFVKDEYEIASLREAFEIQTAIYERIMRSVKPGCSEALGQAIYDYELTMRPEHVGHELGAAPHASLIVASSVNAAIPHYRDNSRIVQDGDLVLIDGGVTVNGYSADITRTFPANGKFTPRQREVYAMVLEAEKAAIATIKPGSTILQAHQAAYEVFLKYDMAQYSYGNCGHPVGLNIHDANGRWYDDRDQPFEPGVVVVIEPFLMLHHEGMGVRIEDGVLVTENGHEVLAGPPREIEDVEALCQQG